MLILFVYFLFISLNVAQVFVIPSYKPIDFVYSLLNPAYNISLATSTLSCPFDGAGLFYSNDSIFPFKGGFILTNGFAATAMKSKNFLADDGISTTFCEILVLIEFHCWKSYWKDRYAGGDLDAILDPPIFFGKFDACSFEFDFQSNVSILYNEVSVYISYIIRLPIAFGSDDTYPEGVAVWITYETPNCCKHLQRGARIYKQDKYCNI